MQKTCALTGKTFEVTDVDRTFYETISPVIHGNIFTIPEPNYCPEARMMHLTSFRNEHSLHHNTCAMTGKNIISLYKANSDLTIYENDAWWSDNWDAKDYAKDIDFSRPFFEQFQELWVQVPKMARIQQGENVNSQYTNTVSSNKNCYLIFSANENEDCFYSTMLDRSKNCIDCQTTIDSELCLECINVEHCYNCKFLQDCNNCIDSMFLKSCTSCSHCFGCINLINKQYCIFNEQHSKEEYEKKLSQLHLHDATVLSATRESVQKFFLTQPFRYFQGVNNQNVSGNYISSCKNSLHCFDVDDLEDCKYCVGLRKGKDSYDVYHYGCTGTNERLYMCEAVGHGAVDVLFSKLIWGGSSNVLYSYECFASKNCFGCTGLRHDSYCILNKQYTKEEYEQQVAKLIRHMQDTGEWGNFFPISMSPFGYNETYAQDVAPLTKQQAISFGWKWLDEPNAVDTYMGPESVVPKDVLEATESLCNQIFLCKNTGKPYKILPQELEFYQEQKIALPRLCPTERHRLRMKKRNSFHLWIRQCAKCSKDIKTTYSPERPEIVYCEECYLKEVY